MKFPNKCCRCGYCCLAETCPIGVEVFGISRQTCCPALTFNSKGLASCKLVEKGMIPIGEGCCIKATAYKNGIGYSFADLPSGFKVMAAMSLRMKKGGVI